MRYTVFMRRYYSARTGTNSNLVLTTDLLRRLIYAVYKRFYDKDYFQEALGYVCVDDGDVPGTLGASLRETVLFALRKDLWPFAEDFENYSEDDLFDVIEWMYDHVSRPVDARYHCYGACGNHWTSFEQDAGRAELRGEINFLLADYEDGWELSIDGELLRRGEPGLNDLLAQPVPEFTPGSASERIESAVRKWRVRGATPDDRRDAVRDLVDVLEFLRPDLTTAIFQKDEADLFNIANNFALRHWNDRQKTGYDASIWMTWMFYVFLATLHVVLRVLKRANTSVSGKSA